MKRDWSIHYAVTRYMGEGIEVLIRAPIHGLPTITCRRTIGDWDVRLLISTPETAEYAGAISEAHATALHQQFASATIGAVPPSETTIDADYHVLVFTAGLVNRVEYRWSFSLPMCWNELTPIVRELTLLAQRSLLPTKLPASNIVRSDLT